MADLTDPVFLHINEELKIVPPDEVLAARMKQIEEFGRGKSHRSLVQILRDDGLFDPDREARAMAHPAARPFLTIGTDESSLAIEVNPSLLDQASDTLLDLRPKPARPKSQAKPMDPTSTRRDPPEVEEAAKDERNRLGPFILVKQVGQGGMGRVYRAWEGRVGRFVALKVIDTLNPELRERFVREAQIAGRLQHPAIATVYQAGEDKGRSYIAMQFIDGSRVDAAPLPLPTTLEFIRDAARALGYAHHEGVIHRDIKPGNLMVDTAGKIFLTDFGLAKEVASDSGAPLTLTDSVLGTPQYMSPEQAKGDRKEIDHRTDLYSLGATLYKLLAGRPPFNDEAVGALLIAVIEQTPPPLSTFNTAVSPELEEAVERAMAKDPARRFETADAFADELDRLLREKRYAGKFGRARRLARRWLPLAAAAVLLGVALRYGIPAWRAAKPDAPIPGPGLYEMASIKLEVIERDLAALEPETVRRRVDDEVMTPLNNLLIREPGHLHARAAQARALFVAGRTEEAAARLDELAKDSAEDYRIPYLRALLALQRAIEVHPPLPALEAPAPEWEFVPEDWPDAFRKEIEAAAQSGKEGLDAERRRDGPFIAGLLALKNKQWAEAAEALRGSSFPVHPQAWCRAAYLARDFERVRNSPISAGRRERVGAGMALEPRSLRELLPGADPMARLTLHVALARLAADAGEDPEPDVAAGLGLLPEGFSPERRGILLAARARRLALSGREGEDCRDLLGKEPKSWVGKLAAVEAAEPREAIARADELSRLSPEWSAPRILRGAARAAMGDLDDALAEVAGLSETRALLLAARIRLLQGKPNDARAFAVQVLARVPGHPEALSAAAAAQFLLVQEGGGPVEEGLGRLDQALERVPGYVDALFTRAGFLLLRSERARREGRDGRADAERAIADLDAVLAARPGEAPARRTRGVALFSLGRYAEAVKEWKAIPADGDLQAWIRHAEARAR